MKVHDEYMDTLDSDASINQVWAEEDARQVSEVILIMKSLAIADVEPISEDEKSACLYGGVNISVRQTFIPEQSYTNNFSTQASTNSTMGPPETFEPFYPELGSTTQPMQVILNLP